MKVAMPSLSQKSDHERIPTSTPHHWCASSCAMSIYLIPLLQLGEISAGINASPPASCSMGCGIKGLSVLAIGEIYARFAA